MKIFKIILLLVFLSSLSFSALGEPVYEHPFGWEKDIGITDSWPFKDADTHETLETTFRTTDIQDGDLMNPDYEYWDPPEYFKDDRAVISWVPFESKSDTLLGWFKDLTLDEKVEIYNWWKNDSVTLYVVVCGCMTLPCICK